MNLYKKVFWNDFNNNLRLRRQKRKSIKVKRYKNIVENIKSEQYLIALQDINKAFEHSPRDIFLWFSKGKCNYFLNNFKEAIRDLDQVIEYNHCQELSWSYRGQCKYNLNQFDAAIKDLDKTIELDPDYQNYYYLRGKCKYGLGENELKVYFAPVYD